MTRVYVKLFLGVMLVLSFIPAQAEVKPYLSQNEFCIVKKAGGKYQFMNHSAFTSEWPQIIAKDTRHNYEWFFVNPQKDVDENIVAKVYPEMVDALLDSPSALYQFRKGACFASPENQQLAQKASYTYRSTDVMCATVLENEELRFVNGLANFPLEEKVLFFYEGSGLSKELIGIVPGALAKAVLNSPNNFKQPVSACPRHSAAEEYVAENMPLILQQYGND